VDALEASDLHTETFSNARGWIAVRATHRPSAIAVERPRSNGLRSAVQAQRECIEEIQLLLAKGGPRGQSSADSEAGSDRGARPGVPSSSVVPRSEFDRLARRVARLEETLAEIASRLPADKPGD
jgi:hypothetical protein